MKYLSTIKKQLQQNLLIILPFILIVILILAFCFNFIVYILKPGEAGVFWSMFLGGTDIKHIHGEGIHIICPWDKIYVYNVKIQEISPELDVLTKNGLEIHLFLSIRYRPVYKLLGVLHQQIGQDYANKVIVPEIESVLREIIGTMDAEEIYSTGRKVITEAINEAIEQVAQRFIIIDDVLIRKIVLPPSVAEAIRNKIEQKHIAEAHDYVVEKEKKEAIRKRIEGEGIRDQMNAIASAKSPEKKIIMWKGIEATKEIAESENAKIIIIGNGEKGLPVILNTEK
ncbi:membrane protease subunit stomatin/prohibitin-like protein [Candidatus Magnetomorum sp. HK-1]|nr:membrane protease subunit stomatin/prohibitin-like protein [Candidatus Magnetomorum sp. HK-1]